MLSKTSALLLRSAQNAMHTGSRGGLASLILLCRPSDTTQMYSQQPPQLLHSLASHYAREPMHTCTPRVLSAVSPTISSLHHQKLTEPLINFSRGQLQRTFFNLAGGAGSETGKHYRERRLMGYSPAQMYDVVSAVEHYKEFVPWCERSTVLARRGDDYMEAELEVGFKVFVERYTSKIYLEKNKLVLTKVADSTLFNALDNRWEFEAGPTPQSCWLTFSIDFAFKSPLYGQLATAFFKEVVQRMMGAFESRCKTQYGPSSFMSKVGSKPVAA